MNNSKEVQMPRTEFHFIHSFIQLFL